MESIARIRHAAVPTAPYTRQTPNPPFVIPPPTNWTTPMKIVPSYDNVDPSFLSNKDLAIITQNGLEQVAQDSAAHWEYENRRVAQPILDYLYLGPSNVARDRKWLRDEGITMILAARDTKQAGLKIMAFDKLAEEMGIEARYLDVAGYHELIPAFPSAIRMINDHMLRVYREQAVKTAQIDPETGDMVVDESSIKRGKVLVFCETGNDRSASVVSAYIMAILGLSAAQVCQFLTYKRFCVSMDEDLKHTLRAYEDILLAQRTVHQHELKDYSHLARGDIQQKKTKRGIDETVDDDGDDGMTGVNQFEGSDQERFLGRDNFTPFVDAPAE
ncbi:phosphatases II [Xylaria bambusicola]|uniref:phosphatases II n=1 Tax=Xylaria bambusicola TaxID=326684 RepID=UPI0020085077|nr:phosphatases II [Xylaria bambusicola]KAI0502762.1 phosphatases II [Xylaria bambusicola]